MEERDEQQLKAKAPGATVNPDPNDSSESKEEGELSASSDDDHEIPASSGPHLDGRTSGQKKLVDIPLAKISIQSGEAANKSVSTSNPARFVGVSSRSSVHSNHCKKLEKTRMPLIIRFSDDDSSSDSEEGKQGNAHENKEDESLGVAGSRKPTAPSSAKMQMLPRNARNDSMAPRKVSLNPTFVSSMAKSKEVSSKNGIRVLRGQRSHIKHINVLKENKSYQEPGCNQNVDLDSSKLQDLRQLIAIRENELKLKAAKQNKKSTSSPNLSKKATRICKEAPADFVEFELKEPDKKRLKVCESHSHRVNSDGRQDISAVKSTLASEKSTLPIAAKQGTVANPNSSQSNRIVKFADSSAKVANKPAETCPKKSHIVEVRHPIETNHQPPASISNMDLQTPMEVEELHDKELEEAQEHRRKCEVEERNALKAYRKAQRAMMEATSRCSYLYRKRELYSAHLRSHMIDNPNMFWSPSLHNHLGVGRNSANNIPEVNMHVIPSSHQMESELYAHNQLRNDSNVRYAHDSLENQHEDGQDLAYNPISEPDLNMSSEEGHETFRIDHEAEESNLDHVDVDSKTTESQDSLLLEASLRSQLFATRGINNSLNESGPCQSLKLAVDSSCHNDSEDRAEISMVNLPEKDQPFDHGGGSERAETTISELPVQIKNKCHVEKFSSNHGSPSSANPLDNCFSVEGLQPLRPISFLYPILRSPFGHMKVIDVISLVQSHAKCQKPHPLYVYDKESNNFSQYGIKSTEETSMDLCFIEVGLYSSHPEIDPLWPLCMFELRGKCNDDECTWQHVRDNATDGQVMASSLGVKSSKSLDLLGFAPPSYLVCSEVLKADLHPYKSVLARNGACCWQKSFSASLVLSTLLPMGLPSDEPFLHGPGARIESYRSWNRQSSFFHSGRGTTSLDFTDNDESLEMALHSLSQEVNKQRGRIEALKVLARALEADPKSVVLWIVYLHIYYCNQNSIGKDDMYKHAVEHNKASYELWLMYINSREKLDDRLVAYDTALTALPHHAGRDPTHASECILDIFLQMMNTLCVSGKVNKAIDKLYGLFPFGNESNEPCGLFLSNVLNCLTIWDECLFWLCCVYLVIYKKLPDSVAGRFESRKELSAIEWTSTQLKVDERQLAVDLMETAVNSLALYLDSETTLIAAHLFAINHVRCIAVLEGLECSRNLLDKYAKLYPSCLELVLMAARAHELVGFEEVLSNWMEQVPGVQCIWNQYAEFALQNRKLDFVKQLMDRWFHSFWKVEFSQNSMSETIDVAFGLLNLSVYKLLQNDHPEARSAADMALKNASPENYKHCVREHVMFRLKDGSMSKEASPGEMLKILNDYLVNTPILPTAKLLSRKFIQTIKSPRVQQLVSNLFSPMSSDFSLVNLVLQVWYGPPLLPQVYDKISDLVDFVEAILEIVPANYPLAISLCKLLSQTTSSSSSISFWASSILVNALFQTVPVAPEYVWVESANILQNLTDIKSISESFHKRALAVYPFSMKLWKSYLDLSRVTGDGDEVLEVAGRRGIELD